MATDRTIDETYDARLNDLYWRSDHTIDEIVEELGVGRNTLYSSIRPVPTGSSCSTCGEDVVFTNRTNRASGTGTCAACGLEMEIPTDDGREARSNGTRSIRADAGRTIERWRDELEGVAPERAALIGGAAALGVVIGAAAVKAFRN